MRCIRGVLCCTLITRDIKNIDNPLRILLATDYSAEASAAEEYAASLARQHHVLCLLHVFNPPLSGALSVFEPEHPERYELEKLEAHAARILHGKDAGSNALNFECVVRGEVNIAETIVDEAQRFEADFILLGVHGAGKLRDVLMGSQTWQVMKQTNIPVLAIPYEAGFKQVQKIVYVTSCHEREIPAIQFIGGMARHFDADLVVLHLSDDMAPMPEHFLQQISSHVAYSRLHVEPVHKDHFISSLNNYCRKTGASWLAISPEKLPALEQHFDASNPENVDVDQIRFLRHTPLLLVPDYGYLASGK